MASPWATPEELRLHLRLTSIDTESAAVKIAEAEGIIRGALEQDIDAVTGDVAGLVGNGRRVINLPQLPVTLVTSVTVDGTVLDAADWRVNRYGILTYCGTCWPLDADIEVVYDHGYDQVPAPVKQVCLQVAGRAWVRAAATGLSAESLGDRSVTYDKDRPGDQLTAYEEQMLRPYGLGNESR